VRRTLFSQEKTIHKWIVALPDRIQIVFLAVATALGVAVTIGAFRPLVVVPMIVVLTTLSWKWMPTTYGRTRNAVLGAIAAIGVVIIWVGVNLPFASQLFVVTRDPGIYTMTGIWLINNPTPTIPIERQLELAEGISHVSGEVGFGVFGSLPSGVVQMQGGDLLPAFMGAFGWLGGVPWALSANIVIGGVALVALYALARRVVGPLWALLPTVVLGFGMPMMYLARAPFSEMIMLAVGLAGITWLISAVKRGRTIDFAVSGAFFGVAGFTRADAPLAIFGVQAALIFLSFGFVPMLRRARFVRGSLVFSIVSIVFLAAGLVDLVIHKPRYIEAQAVEILLLWSGVIVISLASVLAWRFGAKRPDVSVKATRRVALAATSVVGALLFFWWSRPLWMTNHFQSGSGHHAVRGLQRQEGLTVDDSRSYEEYTFDWIGWYFGPPLLIAAVVGMTLLVYVAVRKRRFDLLVIAAVTLAAAALYFTRVNITPDQPWAFRRILPLITPGFFIGATYALYRLWHVEKIWRLGRRWFRATAILIASSFIIAPVIVANTLLIVAEGDGQYSEVTTICDAIESDTVILASAGQPSNFALTLRTVCNVNVVSVSAAVTSEELSLLIDRIGRATPAVVFSAGAIPGAEALGEPSIATRAPFWQTQLLKTPQTLSYSSRELWLGRIGANGLFTVGN
jgi:hypothetical protein